MNRSAKNINVAVIGAGPAGMTAAYNLAKAGCKVTVYEAGTGVGGLAKTVPLWGQKVDIGPHRFFSSDSRVNRFWLEIMGSDYEMVNRLTRIYYKKRFFSYPIAAADALKKLGLFESFRCVASYAKERIRPTKDISTFEGWVVSRFGRRLFEIFFKTYSEKLWGISCQQLDADFAAQRIKKFSLFEAIKTALVGNKGGHKTLVDKFAYPIGGTGVVYERMAKFIQDHGGVIHFKSPVEKVLVKKGEAVGIQSEDGAKVSYDQIVSSMPISLLVTRLNAVPANIINRANALTFRNTILVYLLIADANLFPDQWLYIHSHDLKMGRVTNFRNWSSSLIGDREGTILCLEYWCNTEDAMWTEPDNHLIDLAKKEIRSTGLIKSAKILKGKVHRINRCYPVYAKGYKKNLKPVEKYLSGIKNLQAIGRYGSFKYNNQDHSILMGQLAAENIVKGTRHNLWEINTDYEEYQESSVIDETGLVEK